MKAKERNQENKEVKWGGLINELLWSCSGANKRLLRQCPTDYAKYAGIGGTILFTGLMAMLSGGYAFSKIFEGTEHELAKAVAFGIFWGLLIFNLDRFMVNSMYADETSKITKEKLKSGLPRIILGIFIGIVISTPIEMRIFKDQIGYYVEQNQNKKLENVNEQLSDFIEQEQKLQEEIDNAYSEFSNADIEATDELQGKGPSQKAGNGPNYKKKSETAEVKKEHSEEVKKKNEPEIKKLQAIIDKQRDNSNSKIAGLKGFAAEIEALNSMDVPVLVAARLLVMLLFIIMEIIPTFFKMMMPCGPYENLKRAENYKIKVFANKKIQELDDLVKTQINISTAQNQARLNAEMAANENLLKQVAEAQAEILQTAIDEWRKEELEKVRANPGDYIRSTGGGQSPVLSGSGNEL